MKIKEHATIEQTYFRLRKRACQIVFRFPLPDFYKDFSWAVRLSRKFLETDPVIAQLRTYATEHLKNDFGHGLRHAVKVTVDAGALMFIENSFKSVCHQRMKEQHSVRVVQCAGLLHDIRRKEPDHAIRGAEHVRNVLRDYPFSKQQAEDVCQAIRNHEAFKEQAKIDTPQGLLVSDCLYDADKFRWGPDNFAETVWDMVLFSQIPLSEFVERYPKGMEKIAEIRQTFRTQTGRKYGPQIIDIGLAIGEELYKVINTEFSHFL